MKYFKKKKQERNRKRNTISKNTKDDPYEYIRKMDPRKESMEPIGDTRKHPERSNLFKSSIDQIKKFFQSRKRRSGNS